MSERWDMSMKRGRVYLVATPRVSDYLVGARRIERDRLFPKHEWKNSNPATRCYVQSRLCDKGGVVMNWLKDFFFCNTWREFFVLAVLASMGFIVFWALLVFVFVLFG
jgi:hypothetical protein